MFRVFPHNLCARQRCRAGRCQPNAKQRWAVTQSMNQFSVFVIRGHFHLHREERHPPFVRITRSRLDCWLEHPPRQPLRQDGGQRRGRAPERPIPSGLDGCSALTAARNLQGLGDNGAVREKPGQRDKRAYSVQLLGR